MTTNEIAVLVKAGNADPLDLWASVHRFAYQWARRWAAYQQGGVTTEDLLQEGFLALLDALEGWDADKGAFLTWYGLRLKAAFVRATGQGTKRDKLDPIRTAHALDAPLTNKRGETYTLEEITEDPAAEAAIDHIGERDFKARRREAIQAALSTLPEVQRKAVITEYYRQQRAPRKELYAALRALRHPSVSRTLEPYL